MTWPGSSTYPGPETDPGWGPDSPPSTGSTILGISDQSLGQMSLSSIDLTARANLAAGAGFASWRVPANWAKIAPNPSSYNWTSVDQQIQVLQQAGIEPVITLGLNTPSYIAASAIAGNVSKASAAQFAAFVTAAVERYALSSGPFGVVCTAFEMWSEPNTGRRWGGIAKAEEFMAFLAAAYPAAKAVSASARVIFGSLQHVTTAQNDYAGWWSIPATAFLTSCYALGAADLFDVLGFEPFADVDGTCNPTAGTAAIVESDAIYAIMSSNGDATKQIWWTAGFSTADYSQAGQLTGLMEMVSLANVRSEVAQLFIQQLVDSISDPSNHDGAYGLVDTSYNPKLAYNWLLASVPVGAAAEQAVMFTARVAASLQSSVTQLRQSLALSTSMVASINSSNAINEMDVALAPTVTAYTGFAAAHAQALALAPTVSAVLTGVQAASISNPGLTLTTAIGSHFTGLIEHNPLVCTLTSTITPAGVVRPISATKVMALTTAITAHRTSSANLASALALTTSAAARYAATAGSTQNAVLTTAITATIPSGTYGVSAAQSLAMTTAQQARLTAVAHATQLLALTTSAAAKSTVAASVSKTVTLTSTTVAKYTASAAIAARSMTLTTAVGVGVIPSSLAVNNPALALSALIGAVKHHTYTFTSVPTGTVGVALTSGAGVTPTISSSAIREGASSTSNNDYYSAAVMPVNMGTNFFSCTVTNADQATSSRGNGPGCFKSDGTIGVFAMFCGNTSTATIWSWVGGVLTLQATCSTNVYSTVGGDLLGLVPSVTGGVVTWTATKNGTAIPLTWTDSSHVVDLPGNNPAVAFKHQVVSGFPYYGPGASALTAATLGP